MELLPEGQQNQVEVLFSDQQKINEFSKLIQRKDKLTSILEKQNQEKEYLDDVSMEIELLDEDELVNYKISSAFVKLRQEEVVERLEKDTQLVETEIEALQDKLSTIESRLSELKTDLYTKFGKNINLER
ncbi:tubulin-binding prefolding complex subunit GIM3 [Cyberlindnera jadinii NRRL Y-1542]|uniref:Prefoldin subunit 4 n=1 Tax=Cyberlindnera jadinii (strain ATCC 18201 / CBS 1600 / BCRC 20928 / JCM 3617 / NBRC 0987 / NRRL Y-1542) TaxID=983966 RepID=A0A1E4RY52_CYBJN|nr:Prefoldin, subunit 4 [Cyberlindnera jadinii NRRL Y-1542]ODV72212.1 Prefoldin, subunit 4 [Cyberlindnera jadinii NRRL Y-1542]